MALAGQQHDIRVRCSRDSTADIVRQLSQEFPKVRLVNHEVNKGYGAAVYTGFINARHDLVLLTDSDKQFNIAEVRQLLPLLADADLVAGYRGAAGAMAALVRRAREVCSYHVAISLTRAAMWYQTLGMMGRTALIRTFDGARNRLPAPNMITCQTPFGVVTRLAPAVRLSSTSSTGCMRAAVIGVITSAEWWTL